MFCRRCAVIHAPARARRGGAAQICPACPARSCPQPGPCLWNRCRAWAERVPARPSSPLLPCLAVVTYSADRLKPNKKKTFKGHLVAGGCWSQHAPRPRRVASPPLPSIGLCMRAVPRRGRGPLRAALHIWRAACCAAAAWAAAWPLCFPSPAHCMAELSTGAGCGGAACRLCVPGGVQLGLPLHHERRRRGQAVCVGLEDDQGGRPSGHMGSRSLCRGPAGSVGESKGEMHSLRFSSLLAGS